MAGKELAPRTLALDETAPTAPRCEGCAGPLRPEYNFCPTCGNPADAEGDRPLYVIEGLTHLFNQVFFESLLETELNRASRYGREISVLVVEIDSFAELEMAYGYEVARLLIGEVAGLLSAAIREPDTVAATQRVTALGAQRFMVLLPETSSEGGFHLAEKVRGMIADHSFSFPDGAARVTVSIGVAGMTGREADGAGGDLLRRATQAVYQGRSRGGNRVQVADAL